MALWEYECQEGHISIWVGFWEKRPDNIWCKEAGCPFIAELLGVQKSHQVLADWEPYIDEHLVPLGWDGPPPLVKSRQHRKELKKELGLQDQYHHKPGMPGQWI